MLVNMSLRNIWSLRRLLPRVLTITLFCVISLAIALGNLSCDAHDLDDGKPSLSFATHVSYGWPLVWRRYTVVVTHMAVGVTKGRCSGGKLAGNLVIWLFMVGPPVGACEWLLRRQRLRLRWSLRMMLVAVVPVAAFCGWFRAARDRADLQDDLIAAIEARDGRVWVERWGPKWLNSIGIDHFRRQIVAAEMQVNRGADADALTRLAYLPNLRYLFVTANHPIPGMANALDEMSELRMLSITFGRGVRQAKHEQRLTSECLKGHRKHNATRASPFSEIAWLSPRLGMDGRDEKAEVAELEVVPCWHRPTRLHTVAFKTHPVAFVPRDASANRIWFGRH